MIRTDKAMPAGSSSLLPRPHRIEMRVGAPLTMDTGADLTDGAALRAFTDRLMVALQELSGQEYLDVYSTSGRR